MNICSNESSSSSSSCFDDGSGSINDTNGNQTLSLNDPEAKEDKIVNMIRFDPTSFIIPSISLFSSGSTTSLQPLNISSSSSPIDSANNDNSTTTSFSMKYLVGHGTGFILTPNGHIATDAHVIQAPTNDEVADHIRYFYEDENIFQQEAAKTADYILRYQIPKYFPDLASVEPTNEAKATLTSAIVHYYLANYNIDSVQPLVYVHTSFALPNAFELAMPDYNRSLTVVPAKIIPEATGQYPGRDLAVIKIDTEAGNINATDSLLPTLPLGDEKSL